MTLKTPFFFGLLSAYCLNGFAWLILLNFFPATTCVLGNAGTSLLLSILGIVYFRISAAEMKVCRERIGSALAIGALWGLATYVVIISLAALGNYLKWLGFAEKWGLPLHLPGDLFDIVVVYSSYIHHSLQMGQFLPLSMGSREVALASLLPKAPYLLVFSLLENVFMWGFAYPVLRRRLRWTWTTLIVSLLFLICHIITYAPQGCNLLGFPAIFIVSIMICLAFEFAGSFYAALSLHWVCLFLMEIGGTFRSKLSTVPVWRPFPATQAWRRAAFPRQPR
ncbi:MAG: CPBP family intramembrane metalloprotease [Elusimicrobia bacterium]|nr:CPBP family intramembrane metalloprotease [Elusimicrobiota bacterium]